MARSLFGKPRPFPESGLAAETRSWTFAAPPNELELDGGGRLGPVTVAYQTYGSLTEAADNAVLVCHSLTGDCHAAGRMPGRDTVGWWDPLIGPGRAFDTDRNFVVCASVLGGCGGSTGPTSVNPAGGEAWGGSFPRVTMRDIVRAHAALLDHLGVRCLEAVSGPSMGGSQSWEFAVAFPDLVRNCIPVAASPTASAMLIGWNAVARRALEMDPNWLDGHYPATGRFPAMGLSVARQLATLTYYSPGYLDRGFGHAPSETGGGPLTTEFAVERFLIDEGEGLVSRFDANAYVRALDALDTMDVGRHHGGREAALRRIRARVLVIGVESDLLFPPQELQAAVEAARYEGVDAHYAEIESQDGHDACLLEIDKVTEFITGFLRGV